MHKIYLVASKINKIPLNIHVPSVQLAISATISAEWVSPFHWLPCHVCCKVAPCHISEYAAILAGPDVSQYTWPPSWSRVGHCMCSASDQWLLPVLLTSAILFARDVGWELGRGLNRICTNMAKSHPHQMLITTRLTLFRFLGRSSALFIFLLYFLISSPHNSSRPHLGHGPDMGIR